MSIIAPQAAVIHSADAEILSDPSATGRLLLDSSATGGALSSLRMTLGKGADGAVPHLHTASSELFYVLGGRLQVLAGTEVLTLEEGDMAVVPPHLHHAFAAAPGSGADLLIVITPGVERFEYFRLLGRLRAGQATLDDLLNAQDRYDNHFVDDTLWKRRNEH